MGIKKDWAQELMASLFSETQRVFQVELCKIYYIQRLPGDGWFAYSWGGTQLWGCEPTSEEIVYAVPCLLS